MTATSDRAPDDALDTPIWSALTGAQAVFAERNGSAVRFRPDVARFAAVEDPADPRSWSDLGALIDGEPSALFATRPRDVPSDWQVAMHLHALQMVETPSFQVGSPDVVALGDEDVPEMLDLVARTEPGPFFDRTIELGGYVGVRAEGGRLAAMAGRRMRPGDWCEVSAVCTDPAFRGRGYARAVIGAVVSAIREDGLRAFLHVTRHNPAADLYRSLGFEVRREVDILLVQPRR